MKTPKYQTLDGEVTDGSDPNRGVWYSAGCKYWTDDWSKLSTIRIGGRVTFKNKSTGKVWKGSPSGIPCCPGCGSVGFQAVFDPWMNAAKKYQDESRNGYVKELLGWKEHCSVKEADDAKR